MFVLPVSDLFDESCLRVGIPRLVTTNTCARMEEVDPIILIGLGRVSYFECVKTEGLKIDGCIGLQFETCIFSHIALYK